MNPDLVGLAVALGAGLMMGIERERSKGEGRKRRFAGVRTFALASLGGALAALTGHTALLLAGALLVAGLALVSHLRTRSGDPGVTTEVALFLAYVIGVAAMRQPTLAAGVAAVATVLLAARLRLHEFSVRVITPRELHDALVLTALALVVLPLLPDAAMPVVHINPRALLTLVIVLLAVQAAGHVARRLLGMQHGLALAGLASGFVSSTATIAAMGARHRTLAMPSGPQADIEGQAPGLSARRARQEAEQQACVQGALLSNVATMLQLLLVAWTIRPAWLAALWPAALAGALAAALLAVPGLMRGPAAGEAQAGNSQGSNTDSPAFSLRAAVVVALLLTGVQLAARWAGGAFGEAGLIITATLAGLADIHAAAAAMLAQIDPDAPVPAQALAPALTAALAANTLAKLLGAWAAGGRAFALRLAPGLLLIAVVFAAALRL
jgi:uncharacterized membrane protein (DUF4010 family)